ncbi:MAG: dihydropteroate synthase [Robiginitomaculum sp.]|nr:MAG: dihydropteroate synthase [Robiginitomaculum sp.]
MGILNVTPDSFSDGGLFVDIDLAVQRAHEMCEQGADIIDIGGESTRPGAEAVSGDEELARVLPVIKALVDAGIDAKISIDTRRSQVARAAIGAGAHIWNDVTALSFDEDSISVAAELACPIVLMHMQGAPETMQDKPLYENVVDEVYHYLENRIDNCVRGGVLKDNITIDLGIGFGKRLDDNLALLEALDSFHALGCPILMGTSRKSFIGKIDNSAADARLGGSLASALWAASLGASILRVHDVQETVQAVEVWHAIRKIKK